MQFKPGWQGAPHSPPMPVAAAGWRKAPGALGGGGAQPPTPTGWAMALSRYPIRYPAERLNHHIFGGDLASTGGMAPGQMAPLAAQRSKSGAPIFWVNRQTERGYSG